MKHVYGWLLLTPAAILLIAFTHYPAAATLLDSFFSTGTAVRPSRFVGLGNYASLADDPIFWKVLANNFWFALGTIPTAIRMASAIDAGMVPTANQTLFASDCQNTGSSDIAR